MENTPPLLRAEGITKLFSTTKALKNVDFEIEAGRIVCLAGENGCGKSTLVKVISGVHSPDEGRISIAGTPLPHGRPICAIDAGIHVIFQDLALFDHLSVEENIAFSRILSSKSRLIRRHEIREIAQEQLDRIGVVLDPTARVSSLSVANKQVVAICRALSMDAKVLFMDEPTAALTSTEVDRLLSIVLDLKREGLSIVFISHKLDEVFKIADTITILRDGVKIGDFPAEQLDADTLVHHMTGRHVAHGCYTRSLPDASPLLKTERLTRNGHYADINIEIQPGDILGVTGLLGSGRTELALSLFGLNPPSSGTILIDGRPVDIKNPWTALELGIALLPEDRKSEGLFLRKSIETNLTSSALDSVLTRCRNISHYLERSLSESLVNAVNVNNRDVETPVGALSGGNQQKVVIGKWMASRPKVLILDSPTVGIDIGAKEEIYESIKSLANDGMGVLVISDEAEEISTVCNKVLVMHEGSVVETFNEDDMSAATFTDRLIRVVANPPSREAKSTEDPEQQDR
ncbi:sugar ABC transporter ATP-binding protein [Actinomyces sp. B33]|uniref:sugar ABC transporter ATP-binding protein n=1 Tax=Actinomyces sp. B33 TaxID=2942131 RepID=UPI00233F7DA6|nr:sugar ABC transporter ATP-binding protein [Actinomyces sp. B33]MDC4232522.1 sugar ABC transporter ATP-binding protein [Actinomyces sp. B33]